MKVKGIHHISTIVGHPQENVDFYTSLMGLRLIKRAVNFDDANTYHFYYGNKTADPGTIITFFPWNNRAKEGRLGGGQVARTTYAIPKGSRDFWIKRLDDFKVSYEVVKRFDEEFILFKDKSNIQNELVETDFGKMNDYEYNGVNKENAIKGFYGALLYSKKPTETKNFFINVFKANLINENNNYYRLSFDSEIGKYVDLDKKSYEQGRLSIGTVHHLALTVSNEDLYKYKEAVEAMGIFVSDVKNRDFFESVYFREPGGTIIELASETSGFIEKEIDDEGLDLYLPEHFEEKRIELEEELTPIFVTPVKELKDYPYTNRKEYLMYEYHQSLLSKINNFAKIAKERELTKEEIKERELTRNKYIENIRNGFMGLVDSIKVEDEKGEVKPLSEIKKGEIIQ
ncbi:MAG TPA: DUF896 domain-containing protein [Acholeplasmataceae bacterium]|nr:DUF896 domain-containing protein [Acholeplasmataceae bacterium]